MRRIVEGLGLGLARATASLALASVVLALGVGPTGFPKQVSERCKAGGSWTPTAMANPRRRTRALRYFGAGGWPVGLPETIFRAKLPRQPWQTRSVILALGAGPSGFPKQVSERRKAGGSWRPPRHMRPEAYVATRAAQIIKGEDQASGRSGRFINQKRTNGQISSFGLRMAVLSSRSGQIARSSIRAADCRFHIAPYKEFISGQAEPFLSRAGKAIGRFIKAGQPQWAFYQRRWPFYQGRPASIAVLSRPGQWPQWPVYHQEAAAEPDL